MHIYTSYDYIYDVSDMGYWVQVDSTNQTSRKVENSTNFCVLYVSIDNVEVSLYV